MRTNPKAKRVLIYGDSIPWGIIPGTKPFERYPADIRWPGRLQQILGDDYEVIEENLVGRTLNANDERPGFEGRNGMTALATILDSQDPLDILIISLGLNEAKSMFGKSVKEVTEIMKSFLEAVKGRKPNFNVVSPRIILILPPVTNEQKAKKYWGEIWDDSSAKSEALGLSFAKIAKPLGIEVCRPAEPGYDGVHLDELGHEVMAKTMVKEIKST